MGDSLWSTSTLDWETSAAKDTKSYFNPLPALERFSGKLNFAFKVDALNLETINQAKNISTGLPSSPIKIWGKSVQEFLSYDLWADKKTGRQTKKLLL